MNVFTIRWFAFFSGNCRIFIVPSAPQLNSRPCASIHSRDTPMPRLRNNVDRACSSGNECSSTWTGPKLHTCVKRESIVTKLTSTKKRSSNLNVAVGGSGREELFARIESHALHGRFVRLELVSLRSLSHVQDVDVALLAAGQQELIQRREQDCRGAMQLVTRE